METTLPVRVPFQSIRRYNEKYHNLDNFIGKHIVIMEKLDGSNVQIERVGDKLILGSRSIYLTPNVTLNGAYDYVQTLDVNKFEEGYIYFGEWLVSKKLDYAEHKRKIRLFAIAKSELENEKIKFVNRNLFNELVEKTGFQTCPNFYEGTYVSKEHILDFVGKSELVNMDSKSGRNYGEGVVVYFYDTDGELLQRSDFESMILKFVYKDFSEYMQKGKTEAKKLENLIDFVNRTVLETRVEKVLMKAINSNIFKENYTRLDYKDMVNKLKDLVWEDVLKEESEEYEEIVLLEKTLDSEITEQKVLQTVHSTMSKVVVATLNIHAKN